MNLLFIVALFLFQGVSVHSPKIDVSPITEQYGESGFTYCDMGNCQFVPVAKGEKGPFGDEPHQRTRFTCADKTRFLMTSEDGNKHCIKLD